MPLQRICRIIGRTDQLYPGTTDDIPNRQIILLQLCVAELPHLLCRVSVQIAGVAKVSLQLQMAPVIKWIPDCERQRLRPLLKFFPVRGATGNIIFVNAIGTHLPPFIMIPTQPYLRDILKLPILSDLLRIDMAVVVDNRHPFRIFMKQLFRGYR